MERALRALLSGLALLSAQAATSAAAQGVECTDPGNHLVNCGFDTSLSGWSLDYGTFVHQPADGFPQPGSLEATAIDTPTTAAVEFRQAVPVLAQGTAYDVGIDVRLVSGSVSECSLTLQLPGSSSVWHTFTATSQWQRVGARLVPAVAGSSATFIVTCFNYSQQLFTVRFDDAYLGAVTDGADVSVALSSCTTSVALGGGVAYSAVVRNLDPIRSADVDVVASLPGTCRWSCAPGAGAFCTTGPVPGPLADAAYLPVQGSATYDITCLEATGGSATLTATVLGGADPHPGNNSASVSHTVVPAGAGPYVKGDLTGDMQTDLLLRQQTTWNHAVWEQVGSRRLGPARPVSPTPDAAWHLEGVDDFDGDHRSDLAFRDPSTGAVELWLMNGLVRNGAPVPIANAPPLTTDWRLSATGDFDSDGWPDLLWRNGVSQKIAVWTMNGASYVGTLVPTPDQAVHANWEIVAALDYDGDGLRDLLWYNSTSGKIVLWLLDAGLVRRTGRFTSPPNAGDNNWKVLASGDHGVGADGQTCTNDLVWRNANSGKLVLWDMDGAGTRTSGTFTSPAAPSPDPLSWTLVGPR